MNNCPPFSDIQLTDNNFDTKLFSVSKKPKNSANDQSPLENANKYGPFGDAQLLGDSRDATSHIAFNEGEMASTSLNIVRVAPQKGKIAYTSTKTVRGSFVAEDGIQPYGWCSGLVNRWLGGSNGGCSGLILDFQNSVCFPYTKQPTNVSSLGSDFDEDQVVLDFENSIVHLPSAEKNLKTVAKLNTQASFRSNVVNGFLRDDRYEFLFRQSVSVETQPESSSKNSGRKNRNARHASPSYEDVSHTDIGSTQFQHAGNYTSHLIGKKRKRHEVSLHCRNMGAKHFSTPCNGRTDGPAESRVPIEEVFEQLKCNREGLSVDEGAFRLQIFEPSKLEEKKESKILKFLGFMWNPLSWVMEATAIMAIAMANGGGKPPDWQDLHEFSFCIRHL